MERIWNKIEAKMNCERKFLRKSWYDAGKAIQVANDSWENDVYFEYIDIDNENAAVFPYAVQKVGPLKYASLAGNMYPYRGVPNTGPNEDLVKECQKVIAQIEGVNGIRIGPIKVEDLFEQDLIKEFNDQGWHIIRKSHGREWEKPVNESEEEYLKTLSNSRKRKIKYYRNKLNKLGDMQFKYFSDEKTDTWKKVFSDIEKIEQNSWVAEKGDPRFVGKEKQKFWNDLASDDWFSKAFRVIIIYIDDEPLCHNLSIDIDTYRHGFDGSYDKKIASCGAGIVMEVEAFKEAIDHRLKKVNNGQGTDEFKKRWGSVQGCEIAEFILYPPTIIGYLTYSLNRLKFYLDKKKIK